MWPTACRSCSAWPHFTKFCIFCQETCFAAWERRFVVWRHPARSDQKTRIAFWPTPWPTNRKTGAETTEKSVSTGDGILWQIRLTPLKRCGRRPYRIFDCKRRKHTQTGGTERFSLEFAAAPPCLWWVEWRIACSFLQNNQRSGAAHSTHKEKIQIPVEWCVVQRTFVCETWAAYKGIFLECEGIIEKSTNRFPVKVNDIVRFP